MNGFSASDYEREYSSETDFCAVGPWVRWVDQNRGRRRGRGRRENYGNPVKRPRAPKPEWSCYDIKKGLRKRFVRIKGPDTIIAHPPHGSSVSYDWKCIDEPGYLRQKIVKTTTIHRSLSDFKHLSDSSSPETLVKVEPPLTIPNIDSSFYHFRCDLSSESDENNLE